MLEDTEGTNDRYNTSEESNRKRSDIWLEVEQNTRIYCVLHIH